MRVEFKSGVIGRDLSVCASRALTGAWYPIAAAIASETPIGTGLPRLILCVRLSRQMTARSKETRDMTSRLESYRVQAYNTAKLSENKMHDDTGAQRFGFSGGLVPGVDVMAYMMHLPVKRWGRAFLEHGLIEARFVKPVYDGEIANVTAEESDGVLTIEVESRGQLCGTGTAFMPVCAPSLSLADFSATAAVPERRPVNTTSYEPGKWLGTVPRAWAGEA